MSPFQFRAAATICSQPNDNGPVRMTSSSHPISSNLKMLDSVHPLGLRLATGAFRMSPVASLYVETGQISLEKRRCYLGFSYFCRLNSIQSHSAKNCLQNSPVARLFESKPSIIRRWACCYSAHNYFLKFGHNQQFPLQ